MAFKITDRSKSIPSYARHFQAGTDEKGWFIFAGYVVTAYGIVGVQADFSKPGGITCLEFFWNNRLFVRQYHTRLSFVQASTAARKFAVEVVHDSPRGVNGSEA